MLLARCRLDGISSGVGFPENRAMVSMSTMIVVVVDADADASRKMGEIIDAMILG